MRKQTNMEYPLVSLPNWGVLVGKTDSASITVIDNNGREVLRQGSQHVYNSR